jgi:spermidine synthase
LDQKNKNIQDTVGDVFSFDYIWSLIGTLLFPFVLLPWLGLTYTAFAVWMLNLVVAGTFLYYLKVSKAENVGIKFIFLILVGFVIFVGWAIANAKLESIWENFFYKNPIIFSKQTPYQKIIITQRWEDVRLYLNGHLQFLSLDENRYHTALTYFASKLIVGYQDDNQGDSSRWCVDDNGISLDKQQDKIFSKWRNCTFSNKLNILVLWGGDGLAVRNLLEILKTQNANYKITLVDLDPQMTQLAKTFPILVSINKNSLN